MEVKKSSKANLENKKGIFFEIGLIVALACIFLAFEWKVDVKMEEGFIVINTEEQLDEEIIPVTQRIQHALPPPPPAPRLTDLIEIVDEEITWTTTWTSWTWKPTLPTTEFTTLAARVTGTKETTGKGMNIPGNPKYSQSLKKCPNSREAMYRNGFPSTSNTR